MTRYEIELILKNHYSEFTYPYYLYKYKGKIVQCGEIHSSGLGYLYIDPLGVGNVYVPNQGMRIRLL